MAWLGDLLSDRLELRSSVRVGDEILEGRRGRLVETMRVVEADRRATVEAVARWLESQDLDGRDVPALLRRELLGEEER